MGRRKDEGRDILEIERCLGFWWPRGISRQRGRCEVPVVKALLDKIGPVVIQHSTTLPASFHTSEELKVQANDIFDAMGPKLWPDSSVNRSAWLATNADVKTLEGFYPRDLYFSNPKDQAEYARVILTSISYLLTLSAGFESSSVSCLLESA